MKPNSDKNSKQDATGVSDGDESFVRQQLKSLGQPEPIAREFVESLSEQLDEAFAATMAEGNMASEAKVDHDNFSTLRHSNEIHSGADSGQFQRAQFQRA